MRARSKQGSVQSAAPLLAALAALHVLAALIFSRGFLLTRVELPDVSACPGPGCLADRQLDSGTAGRGGAAGTTVQTSPKTAPAAAAAAPYSKAVLLIVDALRFDFVCENRTEAKPYAGLFPRTMALVGDAVSLSRVP